MPKSIQWLDKSELDRVAIKSIRSCNLAVDIGTGIRPHDFIDAAICICFEPYAEYVEILKDKVNEKFDKIYVVEQQTWSGALDFLAEKSVDTVFLIDVIEHLEKDEGEALLKRTEKIARQQIVIFTPLGFVAQHTLEGGKDAWGLDGAEWQEHKSGWLPEDFDDTWDVYACREYHEYSNVGTRLEVPFGAFWAVKTIAADGNDFNYHVDGEIFELISRNNKKINTHIQGLSEAYQNICNLNQGLQQYHRELQDHLQAVLADKVQIQEQHQVLLQHHEELQQCFREAIEHSPDLQKQCQELQQTTAAKISRALDGYPMIKKILSGVFETMFRLHRSFTEK